MNENKLAKGKVWYVYTGFASTIDHRNTKLVLFLLSAAFRSHFYHLAWKMSLADELLADFDEDDTDDIEQALEVGFSLFFLENKEFSQIIFFTSEKKFSSKEFIEFLDIVLESIFFRIYFSVYLKWQNSKFRTFIQMNKEIQFDIAFPWK